MMTTSIRTKKHSTGNEIRRNTRWKNFLGALIDEAHRDCEGGDDDKLGNGRVPYIGSIYLYGPGRATVRQRTERPRRKRRIESNRLIEQSQRQAQKEMEGKLRITVVLVKLNLLCFLAVGSAVESPQYTVVHAESDFEVRLYGESKWMSAPVRELSFEKATLNGFHRLFQFIEGANLNCSRIPMTFPVVTSIVPGAGPLHSSAYSVLFYLPAKFQAAPPSPLPKLHLKPYSWANHCVAIRRFLGFAKDDNIVLEAENLAFSLSRSTWANATSGQSGYAYSIAQYSSPFQLIGRVNEVWVDVNGSGCTLSGLAAY